MCVGVSVHSMVNTWRSGQRTTLWVGPPAFTWALGTELSVLCDTSTLPATVSCWPIYMCISKMLIIWGSESHIAQVGLKFTMLRC